MGGKRTSARVTAYLPPEIAESLKEKADAENRTVSNLVSTILIKCVESEKKEQEKKQ